MKNKKIMAKKSGEFCCAASCLKKGRRAEISQGASFHLKAHTFRSGRRLTPSKMHAAQQQLPKK
jgi:hypothetical protein